jgi:hypothetical protein
VQLNPDTQSPAQQFYELREQMLGDQLKEILGPETQPDDVANRLDARHFPDGEFQVLLDGQPILQVLGPVMQNGFACVWKTANFRTA